MTELAQDKNWRIRSSSIEIISFFAKEIVRYLNSTHSKITYFNPPLFLVIPYAHNNLLKKGQEFLNEKILKILMEWLSDKVYGVREAAV